MGVDDAVMSADFYRGGACTNLYTLRGMSLIGSSFRLLSRDTSVLICLVGDFCAYYSLGAIYDNDVYSSTSSCTELKGFDGKTRILTQFVFIESGTRIL